MSIHFTLPARTLHPFQARRAGFNYQPSPLSPLSKPTNLKLVNPAESNRSHLSNLEKLLQKDPEALSAVHSDRIVEAKPVQKGNRNILENLNLGRLWPEMKAAEDMSPRHLNRLKRLLSMTAQYSPRNGLGGRWREYHGSNDWAGLLDPLDENLRREVVRYGEFIQAAYHAFNSDPATSPSGPPLPRRVALPDKSYRVTRSLYATSSVGLPRWVDDVAPTLEWMTQRSSWIGYVAVCDDKREIQRMGRRDIIIALRGTSTCLEWAENVRAQLVPNDPAHSNSKVECGFLSLYKTRGSHVPSLSESVVTEVQRLTELYKGEALSITVTGHSLGAALALLAANDITTRVPNAPPVAVFSFGGPRVGNKEFADTVNDNNVKVLRIVNSQDVITRVPAVLGAYSHVGTELRVDTKTSPYLKPNADVACCHDLEAYLHLVDGFMGTDCPFRENAKRSLVKLVHEQGSNVKKLYTSKAKNLSNLNLQREGLHVSATCLPSPSSS